MFLSRVGMIETSLLKAPKEIYKSIKAQGMLEQVLVKSPPVEKALSMLEDIAPELPYMAIV